MFTHITVVTAPATEPLSLAEVKHHLRITADLADAGENTARNAALNRMITAAREKCEDYVRRAIITQTVDVWFDSESGIGIIDLPRGPIQSITKFSVFDSSNEEIIVDPASYSLVGDAILTKTLLPAHRPRLGICVRQVCGFGGSAATPKVLVEGMLELIAHWWTNPAGEPALVKYEIEARLGGDVPQQVASKWRTKRKVIA